MIARSPSASVPARLRPVAAGRKPVWKISPKMFPQLPFFRAVGYSLRRNLFSPACLINALAWGCGLGSVNAMLERTHATPAFWGTLLFAFCITYLSTICWRIRLLPRPVLRGAKPTRAARMRRRRAWWILICNGLLATATGYVLLLICLILPVAVQHQVSPLLIVRLIARVQAFIALTGAVSFPLVGYAIVVWQEHKREQRRLSGRARRLERLAEEARLVALRSQINPHFFFNALNTIAALIPTRPADAERAVELLASALRPVLMGVESEGRGRELAPVASLASEIEVAQAYGELEQLRFGGRLQVTFSIDPETEPMLVPALCVQPLVENAIRYGAPHTGESYLVHVASRFRDTTALESACLILEIWNAPVALMGQEGGAPEASALSRMLEAVGDLEPVKVRPGHALTNIRARVRALAGFGAGLEVLVSRTLPVAYARLVVPVAGRKPGRKARARARALARKVPQGAPV